ncbi:MAG: MFS transporter [Saprospiraceae bacterium]
MTFSKTDPFQALRNLEFRFYVALRFFVTMGINMQAVIVGWKVYDLTKSELALGLIGLAEVLPALGLALPAGHLVDKSNKRNLLLCCIVGYFCIGVSLLLLTLQSSGDLISTTHTVNLIYLLMFTGGVLRAFSGPASFSLLSQIVPREAYANAATWSSSGWQFGAVIGPALGGFLYAWGGAQMAFATVIILQFIGIICLLQIKSKPIQNTAKGIPIWQSLTEGMRFVFGNKVILSTLSLDLFAVLFGGAVALLPVFADQILKVGPQGLGILRAAPAAGAAITLVTLAYIPIKTKPGLKLLGAVFGFGLCIIGFGLSKSFFLSVILLFASGALDSVSVVLRSTILQLMTPDNMRGRVAAVNSMFIGSSNELGAFESGVTAKLMGTVTAVVFGGFMTIVIVIGVFFKSSAVRNLDLEKYSKGEEK